MAMSNLDVSTSTPHSSGSHDLRPGAPAPVDRTPADLALGPIVRRAVARRHYGVVATASAQGRPHSAGVVYQLVADSLWFSTMASSRKAVNIAANPAVGLTIPVRRAPIGPPSAVQLQAVAELVDPHHPELRRLAEAGSLPAITGHGELDLEGGCFVRLRLPRRVPVYGIGMSLLQLIRHPLDGARVASVDWSA